MLHYFLTKIHGEMRNQKMKKKSWMKPEVTTLKIKKDTFGGTTGGNEKNDPANITKRPI